MSRKALIAANWKMYKTPAEARPLFRLFCRWLPDTPAMRSRCSLPPSCCQRSSRPQRIQCGGGERRISTLPKKVLTPAKLQSDSCWLSGGTHTLIGHSERRQYFAETDAIVNKKLHTALKHGVIPVVCIGEVLAERESGKTASVLQTQVTGAFVGITPDAAAPIVIAYEPVWAIGTGKTATPEIAADAHRIIRAEVAKLLGANVGQRHAHPLRWQRKAQQRRYHLDVAGRH